MADMQVKLSKSLVGNSGGPFTATVVSGPIGAYSVGDTFRTFCLEKGEAFKPGYTYAVDGPLTTEAVGGGKGPNPDPISAATAWLYSNFTGGTLQNLVAAYTGSTTSLRALQTAIWNLEQEVPSVTGLAKTLVNAAVAAVGTGNYTGATVRVMNLYTPNNGDRLGGSNRQSQLVMVPTPATNIVPVPGAAILGVLGLGLVGWTSRRYAH